MKEQINFRYSCEAGVAARLSYTNNRSGKLIEGFMAFPPGCNAVVQVRLLVSSPTAAQERQITPINRQYVALDQAAYPFQLAEEILKGDLILVDIRNTGIADHEITVLLTRESPELTQTELAKAAIKDRVEQVREERRLRK